MKNNLIIKAMFVMVLILATGAFVFGPSNTNIEVAVMGDSQEQLNPLSVKFANNIDKELPTKLIAIILFVTTLRPLDINMSTNSDFALVSQREMNLNALP